jgi:chaperonin GroEL
MASEAINGLEAANSDERMGFDIVRKATESPIRQMSQNAGYAADLIIAQIKNAEEPSVCDFRTGEVVPAKESGIIDPVKVTISALSNATSAATTLLMADYAIIISEK